MERKARPDTALVLCGGGITGWLWEIGALTALDDYLKDARVTDFGMMVGTSAGSLTGGLVANGVPPKAIYKSVIKHRDDYISMKRHDFYGVNWSAFGRLLENLFTHTLRGLWGLIRHPRTYTLSDFAFALMEGLPPGVFTVENLGALVGEIFRRNRLETDFGKLHTPFWATATELDTGRRALFGPDENPEVPVTLAVTASSCMPVFFRPVRIGQKDYVDGGIGHVAHLDVATSRGARFCVVLNPCVPLDNDEGRARLNDPFGYRKNLRIRDMGPFFIANQFYKTDCAVKLRAEIGAERGKHPDLETVLVEPAPDDLLIWQTNLMSLDSRVELMTLGYRDAAAMFRAGHGDLAPRFAAAGFTVGLEGLDEGQFAREAERRAK